MWTPAPGILNVIVPPATLASIIAWRNEPGPLSLVFATVKTKEGDVTLWTPFAALVMLSFAAFRCASANGVAQIATSESRMSAFRRRCALIEGLFCFFSVVPW